MGIELHLMGRKAEIKKDQKRVFPQFSCLIDFQSRE